MHRSVFIKELKERLPEIADELNAQDGLLSFEVEVFSHDAHDRIVEADRKGVSSLFSRGLEGKP